MGAITLRNIPKKIERAIKDRARVKRLSMNQAVVDLLEERINTLSTAPGPAGKPRVYKDLQHLAGTWTDEEADEFMKLLKEQRQIEPEMWK